MEKQPIQISTLNYKDMFDTGKVNYDWELQRGLVWTKAQKGLFIHSLICKYPLFPIFTQKVDGIFYVIDGKQRINTMVEFYNDKFPIPVGKNIKPYVDVKGNIHELEGKKYSELSEKARDTFEGTNILNYDLSDCTDEEVEEIFNRLNNGKALRRIEKIRVSGGKETREVINKLLDTDFFKNSIAITDSRRESGQDQEIILQCISVFNNFDTSGKGIESLTEQIKNEGIKDEHMQQLEYIAHYLSTVFPSKVEGEEQNYPYLKKVNIPIIFRITALAIADKIDVVQFFDWVDRFFENIHEEYAETTKAGSAKKENVEKRFNILLNSYMEKFNQTKEEAV